MNKVILIGNVGKDPEINEKVARFQLATTEKGYKLKNGTEVPDRTEWHNVVVWGEGSIRTVQNYIHKGDKLMVEGKIRTSSYEDKNRQKRYVTEIICENFEFLTSKQKSNNDNGYPFPQNSNEPPY